MKIVRRGLDIPVLNVSYADKQFQLIKQKIGVNLQEELNSLQGEARLAEPLLVNRWALTVSCDLSSSQR